MKILAIQNLYPPQGPGGCGIAAQAVVDRLRQRGHNVLVVTSTFGCPQPVLGEHVWRILSPFQWAFVPQQYGRLRREIRNQQSLRRALEYLDPDLALVWSMSSLSLAMLLRLQKMGIPIVHYLHDHWLLHWQQDPWRLFWTVQRGQGAKRFLNRLLAFPVIRRISNGISPFDATLDYTHCMFVSAARKEEYLQAGFAVEQSPVIRNGVDITNFRPVEPNTVSHSTLKLLCIGTVLREKGFHTALEAVGQLHAQGASTSLSIVGPTVDQSYYAQLQKATEHLGIASAVTFLGAVPHEKMPFLFQSYDVLILPSIIPEGLPLTVLEAMACGLPVIATNNGGQTEVVRHSQNGFLFDPGNVRQLINYICKLSDNNLRATMRKEARQWVSKYHDWNVVVSQIEQYLTESIATDKERLYSVFSG